MDLANAGFVVSLINFGQPRVGDQAYAEFAKTKLAESWRVVHNRDPVPHLPMNGAVLSFWQNCTEIYEDKTGSLKTCD
jgi:predicted lipase